MKALLIEGNNDYDALEFQKKYSGLMVRDIIVALEEGKQIEDTQGNSIDYRILEMDCEPSRKFMEYIRAALMDYDQTKHKMLWLDNELVS